MHLYVYYDVWLADAARARVGIRAMQKRLNDEHRIPGRLVRRASGDISADIGADVASSSDETRQRETWMEIYEHADRAFEAQLKIAFDESGLEPLLAKPRHIERFADFD